jgi:hypothetical protein
MAKAPKPDYRGNGKSRPKGAKKKRANQPVPTPNGGKMTDKRWQGYLANIANGFTHSEASSGVGLTMPTVDAYLISNVAAASQLRDAKLLWNRREWPLEQIEEVLMQISIGNTIRQAFDKVGIERKRIGSLYRLLLQDKALRKWYDEARELQAESYSDDIIDISDETMNDFDDEGKVNHEVINRSRLRVDSRKWLSGKWAPRRFGDTKHHLHEGDLNINHAAVLSGGRKRLEKLHAKRKGQTIDGEVTEVVNE